LASQCVVPWCGVASLLILSAQYLILTAFSLRPVRSIFYLRFQEDIGQRDVDEVGIGEVVYEDVWRSLRLAITLSSLL
jgi:hypothetical protein